MTASDADPLNLVVEIKGFRGEDAKDKANTMRTYWVPGVNNLGSVRPLGLCRVHAMFTRFEAEFDKLIDEVQSTEARRAA